MKEDELKLSDFGAFWVLPNLLFGMAVFNESCDWSFPKAD